MRILCLHGQGTNAEIFKHQTASFRSLLPEDYEFVFVDGPGTCEAAPGVCNVFPGPYRCWYPTPTTARMAAAHDYIRVVMDRDGAFDGIMGFSQGAAVAASMMLHDSLKYPKSTTPLFQFAIFIGSPMPFAKSVDHGIDTRRYFGLIGAAHARPARPGCRTEIPAHLVADKAYLAGEAELEGKPASSRSETFYQMFHPTVDEARIQVPVGHVYGRLDPWVLHSKELVPLCDETMCYRLEHDGGHEIPRDISEDLCDVVQNVIARAKCF